MVNAWVRQAQPEARRAAGPMQAQSNLSHETRVPDGQQATQRMLVTLRLRVTTVKGTT